MSSLELGLGPVPVDIWRADGASSQLPEMVSEPCDDFVAEAVHDPFDLTPTSVKTGAFAPADPDIASLLFPQRDLERQQAIDDARHLVPIAVDNEPARGRMPRAVRIVLHAFARLPARRAQPPSNEKPAWSTTSSKSLNRFTDSVDRKAGLIAGVPLKRAGTPEEIAQAIVLRGIAV